VFRPASSLGIFDDYELNGAVPLEPQLCFLKVLAGAVANQLCSQVTGLISHQVVAVDPLSQTTSRRLCAARSKDFTGRSVPRID